MHYINLEKILYISGAVELITKKTDISDELIQVETYYVKYLVCFENNITELFDRSDISNIAELEKLLGLGEPRYVKKV